MPLPSRPDKSPYLLQLLLRLQNVPFHLVSVGLHAGDEQSQFLGCSPGGLSRSEDSNYGKARCASHVGPTPPSPTPTFYREKSVVCALRGSALDGG